MFAEGSANKPEQKREAMAWDLRVRGVQNMTNSGCDPGTVPEPRSLPMMGPGFPTLTLWPQKYQEKGFVGFTCNTIVTPKAFVRHLTSTEEKCKKELKY